MLAIVEIAGLQYKVEQNQKLFVNRLKGEKGDNVSFDKVLLTIDGAITVGAPAVEGVSVQAEILDHVQADTLISPSFNFLDFLVFGICPEVSSCCEGNISCCVDRLPPARWIAGQRGRDFPCR